MICPICGHRPHPGFACNIPEPVGNGDSYTLCECPFEDRRQPEPEPTLFDQPKDIETARAERDEAMARADDHADEEWKDRALVAVETLARRQPEFIADDLWPLIEHPREPRALGPVMMRARKIGLIETTDTYRQSARRHATAMRVWRSRIWEADHDRRDAAGKGVAP